MQQPSKGGPGGTFTSTFTHPVKGLSIDTLSFTPQNLAGRVGPLHAGPNGGPDGLFCCAFERQVLRVIPKNGQSTFNFQALVINSMPLSLTVLGFSGEVDTQAVVQLFNAQSIKWANDFLKNVSSALGPDEFLMLDFCVSEVLLLISR